MKTRHQIIRIPGRLFHKVMIVKIRVNRIKTVTKRVTNIKKLRNFASSKKLENKDKSSSKGTPKIFPKTFAKLSRGLWLKTQKKVEINGT